MDKANRKKPRFDLWEVIVIAVISGLVMSGATGYVVYRNQDYADCSSLTKNPHVGEILNSYNAILSDYYEDIDEDGLAASAISGMMNYLGDPYTTYLNEDSSDYLIDSLKGTYTGIGITLDSSTELIKIKDVHRNSPAEKAGLLSGDIIKKINGEVTSEKTANEVATLIKNATNNTLNVVIERNNNQMSFSVLKGTLLVPMIDKVFEKNGKKVGYIQFSVFSNMASEQFKQSLDALEKEHINSLIIDLRNNSGGYLKGATDIASMFLKQGQIVYSLRNKLDVTKEKVTNPGNRSYPVYILINANTASAAEVLAAALRYHHDTILIGEKSYGKGKVQNTSSLTSGSMLKYTTAEWLTPKGDCIEGVGLIPDVEIKFSNEDTDDIQLQEAINRIRQK